MRIVFKNLINWEEKEKIFSKSWKSRRDWEEKENFFLTFLKIEKRKRMGLKISQIEKRNRIFSKNLENRE